MVTRSHLADRVQGAAEIYAHVHLGPAPGGMVGGVRLHDNSVRNGPATQPGSWTRPARGNEVRDTLSLCQSQVAPEMGPGEPVLTVERNAAVAWNHSAVASR
jgi:hypothetical protein